MRVLANLVCMMSFPPLAYLLAQFEDRLYCLAQFVRCFNWQPITQPVLASVGVSSGWVGGQALAGVPIYRVNYQLTVAKLRDGRVVASYVVPCVRLFETDELNVIWAELVDELGTSPYRLGLEILAIDAYSPPIPHVLPSPSEV
jgi:hypothetical protein